MTEPTRDDRVDYLDAMARKLGDPDAYVRFLEEKLARAAERSAERAPLESGVRPIEDAQPEQSSTGTHVPLSADGAS